VARILIVDDDRETCRFMEELLSQPDRHIEVATDPPSALARAGRDAFDLVVSDINLDADLSGLDVLRAFKQADPRVEVVLISGFGTLETAIEAVRAGAFDYISKPFNIAEVKETVERALRRRNRPEEKAAPELLSEPPAADGLVGRSRAILTVYKQIARASGTEVPVLITGETGTGKELVARAIHRHGSRGHRPFVAVNCGALAEGLLESELFGHVRGSFTGAVADRKGLFEQAQRGTLFLDEIGDTSPAVQVRLLRALEEGEIRPVGGASVLSMDARVIAATNRDLTQAVEDGSFRQDLFYRLSVFPIFVPPLRARVEDIPLLVAHFLRALNLPGRPEGRVTGAALAVLAQHSWLGNVRELENLVERLALGAPDGTIDVDDLPAAMREAKGPSIEEQVFSGLPSLEELEKRYLRYVLAEMKGNRSRAADVMGIDRRTLYRMAERFGIDLESEA
jgi:DNA-binding NtrC family response regulator